MSSSNTAPDEDEAFFISITPAVRRMSEEEKLGFHMSVLQLIKDINNRRKERPVFETTFSSASPATSRTTTPICSLSAVMDADQFSYHPECNSSFNVKTATAAGYTFQSV